MDAKNGFQECYLIFTVLRYDPFSLFYDPLTSNICSSEPNSWGIFSSAFGLSRFDTMEVAVWLKSFVRLGRGPPLLHSLGLAGTSNPEGSLQTGMLGLQCLLVSSWTWEKDLRVAVYSLLMPPMRPICFLQALPGRMLQFPSDLMLLLFSLGHASSWTFISCRVQGHLSHCVFIQTAIKSDECFENRGKRREELLLWVRSQQLSP